MASRRRAPKWRRGERPRADPDGRDAVAPPDGHDGLRHDLTVDDERNDEPTGAVSTGAGGGTDSLASDVSSSDAGDPDIDEMIAPVGDGGDDRDDDADDGDPHVDDPDDDDLESGRSSIKRNVAHMLSSQVVTWSLALVLAVVQPRLLGPATQGRMRLGFSLWTIAAVVIALGTSFFLNLQVARRGRAALPLLGPVMTLRLITWGLISVVFGVGLAVSGADTEFVWIVVLYGIGFGFASISELYATVFIGLERMSAPAIVNVVARFLGTVAAVVVLLAGGRAVAVLIVFALTHLIGLVLIVRALHRVVRVPLHIGRSEWSMILRGSIAFMVAGGILTLYQQVDTVVIALFVEDEALGWYATADALFGTLLFLPTILCSTLFPTFGRLHEHDPPALQELVKRTFATLVLVAVPIGLGTMVVAEQAAELLYGADFAETGPVLAVYGVVLIVTAVTILLGSVAMSTGRQRFWNTVMFVGVLMTVPLDLVLVPWADRTYANGAIGGALAFVVTEAMMLVAGVWVIAPYLLNRETIWRVARILLAGALLVIAAWPTRGAPLVVPVAVGAGVYLVAIFTLRVPSDDELAMLHRVRAKVMPGGGT